MLTILLATGTFSSSGEPGEPSNVTTPAERTITFSRTGQPTGPAQVIDPSDVMDYVLNLTPILDAGEEFTNITLLTLPESAALGFMIMSTGGHAPVEISDSRVRIWVTVDPSEREKNVWNSGAPGRIQVTATTNSVPPRTYQQTCAITVRQR